MLHLDNGAKYNNLRVPKLFLRLLKNFTALASFVKKEKWFKENKKFSGNTTYILFVKLTLAHSNLVELSH